MPDPIADPMTDNEALRRILAEVREIDSGLRQAHTTIEQQTAAVTDVTKINLAADPDSLGVEVINRGPNPAYVYEVEATVEKLVLVVATDTQASVPRKGIGQLVVQATVAGGQLANVVVNRYK